MAELGWKSLGVLEVTALPSLPRELWVRWVEKTDVLLVNGGDAIYLAHHMRESGLADLLPSLDAVWVGLSGGSMVMSPAHRARSSSAGRPTAQTTKRSASSTSRSSRISTIPASRGTRWRTRRSGPRSSRRPAYAMDDDTAIVWVDGEVEVVSGTGNWKLLNA